MGWIHAMAIFGVAGLVLFAGTHVLIPLLSESTGLEPILSWFLIGGVLIFMPLLVAGYLSVRQEGYAGTRILAKRLRFRRMSRNDWAWAIGAVFVIGMFGAGIQAALGEWGVGGDLHPRFMAFEPLSPGRYWILAAWLPFWVLNIMGEEVLWRGVVLPRQEVALGPKAWIANACGWLLFHAAFGWYLMIVLLPILIILPYVVQRRRNSWVGVVIHAGINGPGFIAVALGLV